MINAQFILALVAHQIMENTLTSAMSLGMKNITYLHPVLGLVNDHTHGCIQSLRGVRVTNSEGLPGLPDEHGNHPDECIKLLDKYRKLRWSSIHLIGSGITTHINP
jgi:hypothetical protein